MSYLLLVKNIVFMAKTEILQGSAFTVTISLYVSITSPTCRRTSYICFVTVERAGWDAGRQRRRHTDHLDVLHERQEGNV